MTHIVRALARKMPIVWIIGGFLWFLITGPVFVNVEIYYADYKSWLAPFIFFWGFALVAGPAAFMVAYGEWKHDHS